MVLSILSHCLMFTSGRPRLAALHVATLVYGVIIEIFGFWCPLTAPEEWLQVRRRFSLSRPFPSALPRRGGVPQYSPEPSHCGRCRRLRFESMDLRQASPRPTLARMKYDVAGARLRGLIRSAELGFVKLVDLCGQDEIAFGQTIDLVRPGRDLDFPPGKEDVWVVPLLLCKLAYAVYELQGFAKVGKLEGLRDVVLLNYIPSVHLLLQRGEFLTLEGRHSSSARDACFGR